VADGEDDRRATGSCPGTWTASSRRTASSRSRWTSPRRSRPHNLWEPVPGDHGAHGAFDDRARDTSLQLWASKNRGLLALAGAGLAGAAGLLAARGNGGPKAERGVRSLKRRARSIPRALVARAATPGVGSQAWSRRAA
jgi:hypothetical protein